MAVFAETSTIWPAIWSAIAATFSCGAAITILVIQYWNRQDSVRPDIFVDDWQLEELPDDAVMVHIKKIQNVGKGAALHVSARLIPDFPRKDMPAGTYFPVGNALQDSGIIYEESIPVVAVGENNDVNKFHWRALFNWHYLQAEYGYARMSLVISYKDIHLRDHQTIYDLMFSKIQGSIPVVTYLAPGLCLFSFSRTTRGWWQKTWDQKSRDLNFALRRHGKRFVDSKLGKSIKDALEDAKKGINSNR